MRRKWKTTILEGSCLNSENAHECNDIFRAITDSSKDAIIFVDAKGKINYWNQSAERIFGYTSKETIGKEIHSLVIPKDMCKEAKERIKASIEVFAETGAGYFTFGNVQLVGRCKEGREFAAELSLSPIKLGGKWNAVGVVKDITERKKAEQLLRDAEQRYHTLFNQAPIGVLLVDPDNGSFVEFNDFAHRQFGYTRDEFEKLALSDIEIDSVESEVKLQLSQLLKEGGGEFEAEYFAKNGEHKNIIVTARVIKLAGKTFLHCIFHDISEIRAVQKSLIESESQYRQLVELAQEGVWVLNTDFVTSFVNPRMAEMLGYSQSEMLGKSLFFFIDHKAVHLAKEFLGKYTQGVDGNFEYEFIRKDGTPIYATIAASQIADDNGNFSGTLALVADITVRKEMENKLEQYSKNLEDIVEQKTKQLREAQKQLVKSERLAAIGELAGMVGHDLRNPLSGIKNAAYYLHKKNACQTSCSKEMLDIIDKCVNHSNKIINDLLEYSRELILVKESKSLGELFRDALSMVKVSDKVKINQLYDASYIAKVDSEKTQRVIINLIKNSIDAMPEGGEISIRSEIKNDSLELSFSDTGLGIADDVLPKLFLPLFTTKAQGMGFGLAICKRILDAHEGKIAVSTVKGEGTTFTITLPIENRTILEVT